MIPVQFTDELMKKYKDRYRFLIETYHAGFEELPEVFNYVVFKNMDAGLEIYLDNQFKKLETRDLEQTHNDIANVFNTSCGR